MLLLYGDLVLINNAIIMAKSNSAFMKPMQVSDDLAEVVEGADAPLGGR